jgi:hypothetical protein
MHCETAILQQGISDLRMVAGYHTDAMQLPLKYTVNRNMRRACCQAGRTSTPLGCCVVFSECWEALGGWDMCEVAERCRCLRLSVAMAVSIV